MSDTIASDEWITTGDAARLLGVTTTTVKNLLRKGKLDGYRLPTRGNHWRVSLSSLSDARPGKSAVGKSREAICKSELASRDVFTTSEVALLCRVAARTVAQWFDAGMLTGYRIPGSKDRRITRQSLVDFLQQHNMPLRELAHGGVLLVGLPVEVAEAVYASLGGRPCFRAASWLQAGVLAERHRPACIVVDARIGDLTTAAQCLRRLGVRLILLASEDVTAAEGYEVVEYPWGVESVKVVTQ